MLDVRDSLARGTLKLRTQTAGQLSVFADPSGVLDVRPFEAQ